MSNRQLDVLFIQPNSAPIYQALRGSFSAIETPTWALLLAQACRANGFGAAILDCDALNLSDEQAVEEIKAHNPRLVVFVVYGSEPNQGTTRMASAIPLAHRLKETCPEFKTCFVGSHAQALPKEVLSHPCVDMVLLNEGVYALTNLLRTNLLDLWDVRGIGWKPWAKTNCQEPILNEPEEIVSQPAMDLDLPGYAWDLLPPLDNYRSHFWHAGYDHTKRSPFAAIYTSLNCPMRCSFCMINIISRTNNASGITAADSSMFRYWSPQHTLKQIEHLVEQGVTTIRFSDEMFFLNRNHYEPILSGIKERWGDRLNLWAYARIDTVKPKFLELFRSAGVRWLCLGIEAGDEKVRKEASKGSFQDVNIREVVKQVEEAGIDVISNVIFGLPYDTFGSMQKTLDLAEELNTSMFNCYPAMSLPGTPLYEQAKKEGKSLPSSYLAYGFLSYECEPSGTEHLTPAQVLKFRDDAFHHYWSREVFLSKLDKKFGPQARVNVEAMLKIRLKRKLLGD